jgi:hypothetical protein
MFRRSFGRKPLQQTPVALTQPWIRIRESDGRKRPLKHTKKVLSLGRQDNIGRTK